MLLFSLCLMKLRQNCSEQKSKHIQEAICTSEIAILTHSKNYNSTILPTWRTPLWYYLICLISSHIYKNLLFNAIVCHFFSEWNRGGGVWRKKWHSVMWGEGRSKNVNLRMTYFLNGPKTNKKNYKIQRNLCRQVLKKTEKLHISSLDKIITNDRIFWRTVAALFIKKNIKMETLL